MSIQAVIFDLDGTITEPFFDFDAIKKEIGVDAGPLWEQMQAMGGAQRKAAELILEKHERRAVVESRLNPGAKETLAGLRDIGIRVGILTRNTKANAIAVAEKHGLEFDAFVGREDGPVKPDAFGVVHICELFGVLPSRTLLVGDFLFDLLCAKAAGAIPVLLANNSSSEEFTDHAVYKIRRIDEVLEIIKEESKGLSDV